MNESELLREISHAARAVVNKAVNDRVAPASDISCIWSLKSQYPAELSRLSDLLEEVEDE